MKKLWFSLLILFLLCGSTYAQLPSGWLGEWQGDLVIHSQPGDKNQVITMKLRIMESPQKGVLLWDIFYNDNSGGTWRNYNLIEDDPANGLYKLDENNSIVLDMFYFDNTFYNVFEVGKGLLTARYELRDEKIYFEVTSSNTQGVITGGVGDNPEVTVYPVRIIQKAALTKTN